MSRKTLTRRQWAAAVAAVQTATAAAAAPPQAAPAPESPADLLVQARQAVVRNREALSKFKIDRSLEPAVRFEA